VGPVTLAGGEETAMADSARLQELIDEMLDPSTPNIRVRALAKRIKAINSALK
jgi:hypothetical protein